MIGGLERVGVPEAHERPMLRAPDQRHLRVEDDGAGALAADQCARDVKPAFGQQIVQVVTGDSPGNARELRANGVGVPIPNRAKGRVELCATAALPGDSVEVGVARRAHGQLGAVVEQNTQLFDVVDGLAGEQRVRAARVVADHAAQRAAAVRGGVGTERELVRFGPAPQRVEDDAGLDAGEPTFRIDLQDPVHVFREVEDDGDVAALPGEARPGASWQHGHAELPARFDRGGHVLGVARDDQADRHLAVVGGVAGVQGAAARVEADFPADRLPECLLEVGRDHLACAGSAAWAGASDAIAAMTPPSRCGMPATRSPISTPLSVPISIRSLKLPR